MANFDFADNYKAAGLAPGPDIIRLRQEPFNELRRGMDAARAVDLTRLYFGLDTPTSPTWFRDAFAEADPSFSMLDNEREAAVLAFCLLAAGLQDGLVAAGLGPLTAAAYGNREPVVQADFIDEAPREIQALAIEGRRRKAVDPNAISLSSTRGMQDTVDQFAAAPDLAKVAALFKQAADESSNGIKTLATQVRGTILAMAQQLSDLQEETDMLWWYVAGWSRVLDQPFANLQPALAAVMCGLDLAALTSHPPGPVAAPAILQRLISAGRKGKAAKVTIDDAVAALPLDAIVRLGLNPTLQMVPDICPLLTAFKKAGEIGSSPAWHAPFAKAAKLQPTAAFYPIQLAMQVYREAMLMSLLK